VGQLGQVGDEDLSRCVVLESRQCFHDVDDHARCRFDALGYRLGAMGRGTEGRGAPQPVRVPELPEQPQASKRRP
jgi:hypothetical protein